ncbi:MAG: hypothetical protein U0354_20415 [Candidatus Sericytochromatia bacterium]
MVHDQEILLLADIFFKGGLIESSGGRGTLKIIDECKKYGLPEPEIVLSGGGISVTLFKNTLSDKNLKAFGFK